MNENFIKNSFERWLSSSKTEFKKNFQVRGGFIDYVILDGAQHHGVEARGARAGASGTLGSLVNALRTLSHIYLLAPLSLIKKINQILDESGMELPIGYITPNKTGFVYLKKATPPKYYYRPCKVRLNEKKPEKQLIINQTDIQILQSFDGKPLTVAEVSKIFRISMESARRRIVRLRRAKKIVEITNGTTYPKAYKTVGGAKVGETITLGV